MTDLSVSTVPILDNMTVIPGLFNEEVFSSSDPITSSGQKDDNTIAVPSVWPTLEIIFFYALQIPLLALGVVNNALNIAIFTLSGQRDSVSIALMALSISDMAYSALFITARITGMLNMVFHLQSSLRLGFMGLAHYMVFASYLFQDTSVVVTVFVAVQKCCCVAIPHLFKNFFTSAKTVAIIVTSTFAIALTHIPRLGGMVFRTIPFPPASNKTIVSLVFTPLVGRGRKFRLTFNEILFPATSQVIIIICLIVMVKYLRKSAKFRSTSADIGTASDKDSSKDDSGTSSYKMGYKERRVITCLALVSAISVVSSIPTSLWSYVKLIDSSFIDNPKTSHLKSMFNAVQTIPAHVNASINILIYLKYNTKFKQTAVSFFQRLCCCCKPIVSEERCNK